MPPGAGNMPPDVTDRNVLIVDFCYSLEATKALSKKAKKVLVLDHHKSSALASSSRLRLSG